MLHQNLPFYFRKVLPLEASVEQRKVSIQTVCMFSCKNRQKLVNKYYQQTETGVLASPVAYIKRKEK